MNVTKHIGIITSVIFFSGCGAIMPSEPRTHLFDKENATYTESAIYTIKGEKDKRLEAMYRVYYNSYRVHKQSKRGGYDYHSRYGQGSECKDHPREYANVIEIKNENYEIKIPMFISENNCDFKVDKIELVIRRNYDERYSKYTIFNKSHQSHITYFGLGRPDIRSTFFTGETYTTKYDGWQRGRGNSKPGFLQLWTDKNHFLIAPETNFLCQTRFYHPIDKSDFHCKMRIKDGLGENTIKGKTKVAVHGVNPQFGVKEIVDTTLKMNILVDDNASSAYFSRNRKNEPYHFIEIDKPFFF